MSLKSFLFPLLCAALCAPAAAADEAPRAQVLLEPASDWQLTAKPDSCVLARDFQNGEKHVILQLENFTLGSEFRIFVVTGDYAIRKELPKVTFLPGGEPATKESAVRSKLKDGRGVLIFNGSVLTGTDDDPDRPNNPEATDEAKGVVDTRPGPDQATYDAREKAVDRLLIGETFDSDLVLHTGSMRAAMIAARSCLDPLARKLGLDPVALRTMSKGASPIQIEKWARSIQQDYPQKMLISRIQAQLKMRIVVDANGRVVSCAALPEGQPPDFEKSVCKNTVKVRFTPALDVSGNPMASIYSTTITYRLS